ncbi:MAG TPA: hypothetical protein VGD23_09435 [Sphingomicrobium sp.]
MQRTHDYDGQGFRYPEQWPDLVRSEEAGIFPLRRALNDRHAGVSADFQLVHPARRKFLCIVDGVAHRPLGNQIALEVHGG